MNTLRVLTFVIILILSLFTILTPVPAIEVGDKGYTVQPDGSVLYDSGQIAYGIPTFTATDNIKYLKSDYLGASLVYQGTYWSTPEPSPLSGRFYDDGRIYLGKDTDHYVGMKPIGIFYVNYQDPAEREQLISLTSMSLSVNGNIATYSQGPVDIIFTNSFSQIKGDVIFPNNPQVPTVSNPALAVVWEVVGHAGINMEDGEKSTWWFEQAKAAFPTGDIQNNGSAVLKKKIFRQNGKIYLVEGVGYNWILDVNRTDSHFIIDPTLEYNSSDNWAGTSGTMIEHGDGNLRAPPNVTTGLVSYWNPSTDVGSGTTLTDIWGNNDGTIHGATWNMTSEMLEYNGTSDYVNCGNSSDLKFSTSDFSIISIFKTSYSGFQMILGNQASGQKGYFVGIHPNEKIYSSIRNETTDKFVLQGNSVIDMNVYQVATTYDRDDVMTTYIDNVGLPTTDISGVADDITSQYKIYIGATVNQPKFNGSIGTTYIYSTALTNNQINETNANYHTNSSYRQVDTANDYGAGQVLRYINVTGTDPSANTTMAIYINGSHDNVTFGGWELVNGSCNVGDNVTVPIAYEYRYLGSPGVKIYSNTTYQPETNVIESIVLTSDSPPPTITLLSQTPSTICQNCTGNISICYGISHGLIGLNNTSVSFIYRDYDHDLSDSNHSIRPPPNNLASEWNLDGKILRGANRNESLNFENNATITGGDTYSWSGLDENCTEVNIVPVNSTYTKVYINSTIHRVMPQMHYLDRSELQEAPKTIISIHKTQNVLVKFWNYEIYKGNKDFIGVGYTDTVLNSNLALWPSDANPINVYYISSGYDPSTGSNPLTSGHAVYMLSLNASEWIDHVYSPCVGCSYVRGFIDNNQLESYINTTNISYLYYTSNTASSKAFYINVTDVASPSNVSFADTNVLWAGDTVLSQQSYTPSIWFAFMKLNMSFDHKLYVADNNDNWANSTMNRTNITSGLFPPTKPSFYAFHNGFQDFDMNGTYYDTIQIQVSASSDPDGGALVVHNITLHYGANNTYVATINGSAVAEDGVYTNISFNTTPYYSQTENYTLRVVATDDEGETATTWLGVNFSLDGSPQIISYSPETPVSSAEGENQTFSITTNLLGNVTWYLDSIEVFNEIGVDSSSYSNDNASLGSHNITVITTNINGTNSHKWNWTVRTRLWALIEDSVIWGISVAQYLVSSVGVIVVTAFSLVCILILMMLIGAALSVTKIIYR